MSHKISYINRHDVETIFQCPLIFLETKLLSESPSEIDEAYKLVHVGFLTVINSLSNCEPYFVPSHTGSFNRIALKYSTNYCPITKSCMVILRSVISLKSDFKSVLI